MNYNYAQIDKDNICIGVSSLSGEINEVGYIRILDYDGSLVGKLYIEKTGEFVENPNLPVHEPTYEETKQYYVKKIQDAQLLGETEEVLRLQEEWKEKKSEFSEEDK